MFKGFRQFRDALITTRVRHPRSARRDRLPGRGALNGRVDFEDDPSFVDDDDEPAGMRSFHFTVVNARDACVPAPADGAITSWTHRFCTPNFAR
ncbi:MAG TPA: hypothetical protein VGX69_06580 [Solirubrobacteraceae bacterium]|nr:hypothetical protein [Solirubrobacteraceae bacterium]